MAARLGWADAVTGAPSYTGRALRQLGSMLLGGATAARPLGAFSGVTPGTPSTIATATSTTWTVTPFAGVLDGATAAIAGPYPYAFDTNQTGSVTAAGGSARVDRLDVQVIDPAEGGVGGANPLIQIVYTVGTPGLAAAPAQSHPLAKINVPASGGGAPTVSWVAPYCVAAGGVVPFATKAAMDLVTTFPAGTRGVVLADLTEWAFNGTVWGFRPGLLTGRVTRSTATPAMNSATFIDLSANANWLTAGPAAQVSGFSAYSNGWTIPVNGTYRVTHSTVSVSNIGYAIGFSVNKSTSIAYTDLFALCASVPVGGITAAGASVEQYFAAGDVLRLFGIAASGTPVLAASLGSFSVTGVTGV